MKTVARGACFADYDNDGKMDAFMVNLGGPGYLLHNISPGASHWIAIKLVGHKSNRDGIGAKVEVAGRRADSRRRARGRFGLSFARTMACALRVGRGHQSG